MNEKQQAQGQVIKRAVGDFKVGRWLAGSVKKSELVTLAELEAAGYRVIHDADFVQMALDSGQLVYNDDALDDDPDSPYEGQYVRTYWAPPSSPREQTQ